MLGMTSNMSPIKGEFATKLREEIALAQKDRQAEKTQTKVKISGKEK